MNAERAANGIPADLTESATMTSDCTAHDEYGDQHGGFDSGNAHGESGAGATTEGNIGGTHSVLAQGTRWSNGNPWEDAPFHLLQVMNPRLTVTGADEHGFAPFNCLWTAPQDQNGVDTSRAHPASATFWSFPGDGRTNVPWFEYTDSELPQNPNQVVGVDRHAPTGFDLQLYWDGPTSGPDLSVLCAATLTKTGGSAVDVGRLNTSNYGLFPGSSLVVPKQPLEPSTHYDVSATFSDTDPCSSTVDHRSFAFTTEPKKPVDQMEHIDDLVPSSHAGWVDLNYRIDEPLQSRTSGHAVLTSNYLGLPPGGADFGWGSGGVNFPPPGTGQSVTLTITNDPLTIGSTTWASTPVERTFDGPAAPPGGGGNPGGGGTTPVQTPSGSTGGGAAGSPVAGLKPSSGAAPKAKKKAKRCKARHKAKSKKSKKCKPAHHKKKKKKRKKKH